MTSQLDPDDYDSAADSDFDASLSASSASDSEDGASKGHKRKAEEAINSGDEKIVKEGIKKRRKKGKKGKGDKVEADGEEEGEGGVGLKVRTRSGRGGNDEKKALANTEASTVDVDELWARLNSTPKPSTITRPPHAATELVQASKEMGKPTDGSSLTTTNLGTDYLPANPSTSPHSETMITIKRTYVFAGQTTTEEKLVPASSAEARLYLQSQEVSQQSKQQSSPNPNGKPPLRRPKKRVSMFDPNPNGVSGGAAASEKGPKLNTIEKSKLDWAGYVDQEGIKEELDKAEKGKDGYLGKQDFLGRVGAKREDVMRKK